MMKSTEKKDNGLKDQLLVKIHDHTAVVAVVGLGYVGLPLRALRAGRGARREGLPRHIRCGSVQALRRRSGQALALTWTAAKVAALNRGESYVQDNLRRSSACQRRWYSVFEGVNR